MRGCHLEVDIGDGAVTYRLLEGQRLRLRHADELIELVGSAAVVRPIGGVAATAGGPCPGP